MTMDTKFWILGIQISHLMIHPIFGTCEGNPLMNCDGNLYIYIIDIVHLFFIHSAHFFVFSFPLNLASPSKPPLNTLVNNLGTLMFNPYVPFLKVNIF